MVFDKVLRAEKTNSYSVKHTMSGSIKGDFTYAVRAAEVVIGGKVIGVAAG